MGPQDISKIGDANVGLDDFEEGWFDVQENHSLPPE